MSSTVAEGRNLIPAHEARLSSTHLQIEPGVMRGTLMCSYIHHQSHLQDYAIPPPAALLHGRTCPIVRSYPEGPSKCPAC